MTTKNEIRAEYKRARTPKGRRRIWVKALRSGLWLQGRQALRPTRNKYCCLGVVCDLSDSQGWVKEKGDSGYVFGGDSTSGDLPRFVIKELGLKSASGQHDSDIDDDSTGWTGLDMLNDDHQFSLKQIADVIESEPAGLLA